ncbi:CDP-alcohol phosphatidyltransferase family protein [Solicola sp. PLA-1-18]|uniref:CDP-alcohol phosphatidyltransferase family protein n=1 Tax=Solicola sp. PLA-1-18 TaxID=3380532 RepID=UPI003B818793
MTSSATTARPRLTWGGAPVNTAANYITGVRTVAAITIGFAGIMQESWVLLAVAYAVYWVGDSLDGNVARWFGHETRLGAVFDILSDRACCAVLISGLLMLRPELAPALLIYFLQFMVLDSVLSLCFLRWPIVSPNYFYEVDRTIWRWNWSVPIKTINTMALVLAVAAGSLPVALAIAIVQLAIKIWTARAVLRLVTAEDAAAA